MADAAGLTIHRGSGSFLYDAAGNGYLDAVAGYGVASLGHSHPDWVDAVVGQARRLAVSPLHTDALAEYLTALAAHLPSSLEKTALSSSGTEAVEMAIRLAQTASDRPGILTFREGFHGKTGAVRYTRDPDTPEAKALRPPWLRSERYPACHHDPVAYPDCEEDAADLLRSTAARRDLGDVGAVLVEPVLGTSGNIPPQRGFLRGLRALCDERGWLLIFDESITGMGRTGSMFALDRFGAVPNVLVLSKGLGGGFPFSATCAAAELWDRSALAAPSSTSSSYGGNPLACASARATLKVLASDGFLDRVRETSARLGSGLRALAQASDSVAWPRGVGLMLGFDHLDPASGSLAPEPLCLERFRECRGHGLLLAAHTPRVRINPPLTLSLAEADRLLDTLFEVFA